jgi:hypothetical protein
MWESRPKKPAISYDPQHTPETPTTLQENRDQVFHTTGVIEGNIS